ncbi:MAG: 30S ribosomal protein S20 [Candidatus Melainabacteria bacterium]|nr:30S ribosomal protein S20 [Candidatus Melainabacteria bacterium]
MPRLKSAIKRVKTSERNRLRNQTKISEIKTLIKKVNHFVSKNDESSAKATANKAFAVIDRATSKGILHLKNAAHKKSRISKWLKMLESKNVKS